MKAAIAAIMAVVLGAACAAAGAPIYDRLADDAFPIVEGGVVIEDWPAVARRPYEGDTALGMPPRFHERTVLRGLANPVAVRFAPDGRIFVAEQRGTIKVFDSFDAEPRVVADLSDRVFSFNQLGLLGLALDPDFAEQEWLYVIYSHDAPIGGQAPTYGLPGVEPDDCPGWPDHRCHVSGRLSRLLLEGGLAGPEQVLVEDWCHDGGHTVGTVLFGPDGALYAGAGDNAGAAVAEFGQSGNPPNHCADPPGPAGVAPRPPTAEGGSLRSQDLRTRDDPTGLGGTIIRVDPASGAAPPDNPLADDGEENARRIVAYGLRNPYRFTFRPGTSEIWIADVGWLEWEEINVLDDPLVGPVPNFGWPCYEGPYRQPDFESLGFDICADLYADQRDLRFPVASIAHAPNDDGTCTSGGNVLSALAFYDGDTFPAEYHGAMFVADANRGCIWVVRPGEDGRPDFLTIRQFRNGGRAVDLQVGPDGALYYAEYGAGQIRRIQHYPDKQPPRARIRASAERGPAPLAVTLHGARSSDADGDALTFAWDTDDDFVYDTDGERITLTFTEPGRPLIRLRVTDSTGEWAEQQIRITVEAPSGP